MFPKAFLLLGCKFNISNQLPKSNMDNDNNFRPDVVLRSHNIKESTRDHGRLFLFGAYDESNATSTTPSLQKSIEAIVTCLNAYETHGGIEMPDWLADSNGVPYVAMSPSEQVAMIILSAFRITEEPASPSATHNMISALKTIAKHTTRLHTSVVNAMRDVQIAYDNATRQHGRATTLSTKSILCKEVDNRAM